ncbi:flagellar biosynthetic protein FliO [Lederbergia panacisoli]|uniref:flagellar biosynthetic protein FliO n=1 Tax=Lederbergia panacisoli TaxID=1255251 RepID=UPI00214B88B2|nr:flagellar biosynthetic protein FliO [Lederbergia panacisoli]MCR2820708.1 flagellar biosynthetic protein FliO [Lederbergia panacisoli]
MKRSLFVFTIMFLLLSQADQSIVFAENNPPSGMVDECFSNNCDEEKDKTQVTDDTIKPILDGSDSIGISDIVKMVFALIFVIAILYFLLKFISKRSQSFGQNRLVQNIGGTPLGGNRSIQIIKVGNRLLILGVGENVQLLKEIADGEEYENYMRQYEEQLEQSLQPVDMITKWIKRIKKTNETSEMSREHFSAHLKKQLDEIKRERNKTMNKLENKGSDLDE